MEWQPFWTTLTEASNSCYEEIHCGCKKGCNGCCKFVKPALSAGVGIVGTRDTAQQIERVSSNDCNIMAATYESKYACFASF